MKKILTHLTGIVFLITILIARGCGSPPEIKRDNCVIKDTTKVTIYLKAIEGADGKMHLEMYDSNDPNNVVDDDLETCVWPGMKVVWRRANNSGIRSMKKVSSKKLVNGPIFDGDATTILLNKRRRIRVPNDAPVPSEDDEGIGEYYKIIFRNMDGDTTTIDPYLEIPPP